jgi:alanine-glyoxylate transaminase/serine-glyoxylate transaminase/serine-pyruvate transaminase
MAGLRESLKMILEEEGLDAVFARHHRIAEGVRRAVAAWGLEAGGEAPGALLRHGQRDFVPEGFDSNRPDGARLQCLWHVLRRRPRRAGGQGVPHRPSRLPDRRDGAVRLATIEMAMADLDYPITLGSGVAARRTYYRATRPDRLKEAA